MARSRSASAPPSLGCAAASSPLLPPPAQPPSISPGGMYVKALYDYDADDGTTLSLREGDIIQVITQLESGWWDGVINNVRGWFPSNYCAVVQRPTEDVEDIPATDGSIASGSLSSADGSATPVAAPPARRYEGVPAHHESVTFHGLEALAEGHRETFVELPAPAGRTRRAANVSVRRAAPTPMAIDIDEVNRLMECGWGVELGTPVMWSGRYPATVNGTTASPQYDQKGGLPTF